MGASDARIWTMVVPRPMNSEEATAKAAEWVAELERKAAEGRLWEVPPVADQLADHVARLGLTNLTTQELERRANRALSGEATGEDWVELRQRIADQLAE